MKILLLSQIEVNVAIISASALALRPLFRKTALTSSYNWSENLVPEYAAGEFSAHVFSSSQQTRSHRQIELGFYDIHNTPSKLESSKQCSASNTSEESILGDEGSGITKTTDVRVDIEQDNRGRS